MGRSETETTGDIDATAAAAHARPQVTTGDSRAGRGDAGRAAAGPPALVLAPAGSGHEIPTPEGPPPTILRSLRPKQPGRPDR